MPYGPSVRFMARKVVAVVEIYFSRHAYAFDDKFDICIVYLRVVTILEGGECL